MSQQLAAAEPHGPSDPGVNLTPGAVKVIGFLVAGAALVALADVAPSAALGLAGVLALGVVLTHGSELQQLTSAFSLATGHAPVTQ